VDAQQPGEFALERSHRPVPLGRRHPAEDQLTDVEAYPLR
jgi:hypothetical protein